MVYNFNKVSKNILTFNWGLKFISKSDKYKKYRTFKIRFLIFLMVWLVIKDFAINWFSLINALLKIENSKSISLLKFCIKK